MTEQVTAGDGLVEMFSHMLAAWTNGTTSWSDRLRTVVPERNGSSPALSPVHPQEWADRYFEFADAVIAIQRQWVFSLFGYPDPHPPTSSGGDEVDVRAEAKPVRTP